MISHKSRVTFIVMFYMTNVALILRAPITTAADDNIEYFFIVFRESQALFSSKDKNKDK